MMNDITPLVEPLSLDEAFMDLSGTRKLHGVPPAVMLAKLMERITCNLGLTGSIGLSHNKFLAKVASDQNKKRVLDKSDILDSSFLTTCPEAINFLPNKYKSYFIPNPCDQSMETLNNFKNKKANINIIYLQKNKGVAFSRNLGIRLAKSKYISFLDSDDYWSSKKLKEQIKFMEQSDISFSYTDYTPFFIKNNKKIYKKN